MTCLEVHWFLFCITYWFFISIIVFSLFLISLFDSFSQFFSFGYNYLLFMLSIFFSLDSLYVKHHYMKFPVWYLQHFCNIWSEFRWLICLLRLSKNIFVCLIFVESWTLRSWGKWFWKFYLFKVFNVWVLVNLVRCWIGFEILISMCTLSITEASNSSSDNLCLKSRLICSMIFLTFVEL